VRTTRARDQYRLPIRPTALSTALSPEAIAVAPDHALMESGTDLAAALDQGAVCVEQQLRVVERAAVALVAPIDTTMLACLAASPMASVVAEGTVTA
jgi:hypothetical protein